MRILAIEAHPIFRLGIVQLLRSRWRDAAIAEADGLESARRQLQETAAFDIAILGLPAASARDPSFGARAMALMSTVAVFALGSPDDAEIASSLLSLGARGFATRAQAGDALLGAIARVTAGGRYVEPAIADRIVEAMTREAGIEPTTASEAEAQAMLLIARGLGLAAIATAMSKAPPNSDSADKGSNDEPRSVH